MTTMSSSVSQVANVGAIDAHHHAIASVLGRVGPRSVTAPVVRLMVTRSVRAVGGNVRFITAYIWPFPNDIAGTGKPETGNPLNTKRPVVIPVVGLTEENWPDVPPPAR